MGLKSPVRSPVDVLLLSRSETLTEALDEINCGSVRNRGEPAFAQGYGGSSRRWLVRHSSKGATAGVQYCEPTNSAGAKRKPSLRMRRKEPKVSGHQWRLPRTKVRNFKRFGINHRAAVLLGNTRKGPWRVSGYMTMNFALPAKWFEKHYGLIRLR